MHYYKRLSAFVVLCSLIAPGWAVQEDFVTRAKIETSAGNIVVALDVDKAPIAVANFLAYADTRFYDNTIFHRVIVGFMIQGGGHDAVLVERQSDTTIYNEADNGLKNLRGTIAMARMDEIDSASNQFFINVADNDNLDHTESSCTRAQQAAEQKARQRGLNKPRTCTTFGYAVFGKVIQGMDVVDEIELADTTSREGFDDMPVEPITILSIRRL